MINCFAESGKGNQTLILQICKNTSSFIGFSFEPRIESLLNYKRAIPLRNRVMVEAASTAICYVERVGGGSWKTLNYAKIQNLRIIDLTQK